MITEFCNICGALAAETKTKHLVIDHNHKTWKVRNFLCDRCNAYVGLLESDRLDRITKAEFWIWFKIYAGRVAPHINIVTGICYTTNSREMRRKMRHHKVI